MIGSNTESLEIKIISQYVFIRVLSRFGLLSTFSLLLLLANVACNPYTSDHFESISDESITDTNNFSSARVVKVVDGVTIRAESGGNLFTIRYLGIELPQSDNAEVMNRASQFNRFLVDGKQVELETDLINTDDRGHLLRYVYVDGEMVNKALLANGHATVATFPNEFSRRDNFEMVEENAQRDRKGYWAKEEHRKNSNNIVEPNSSFKGGTLPARPDTSSCDYSESDNPVIKGNIDSTTGAHIYHVPGGFFYSTTVIDASNGDAWLCTEEQAVISGWKRAKH